MPLSLSIYLYKKYQEKIQSRFEQSNTILNSSQINTLAEDDNADYAVRVFHSAVVSHEPVDGRPYYLLPPVPPLFSHDHFKRCLIAEALGRFAIRISPEQTRAALETLDTLASRTSVGIVQIFAWNSLGEWHRSGYDVLWSREPPLEEALSGPTASLIGALLFLDHLGASGRRDDVCRFLDRAEGLVRYKVQQALLHYYRETRSGAADGGLSWRNQNETHFSEGAKEVGLVLPKNGKLINDGTQQADIARRIKRVAGEYLTAAGGFIHECWS